MLALLALTVDETDEAFANIYSTAVSLQNFLPRASQRAADRRRRGASRRRSRSASTSRSYQQFLLLLGAFFVPLFGVLLADWLVAGRHYTREHIFAGPLWRPGMIVSWLVGFCLYEWLAQTQGLGFWTHWLSQPPSAARRHRRVAAELRRRRSRSRSPSRAYAPASCGRSA